MKHKPYTLLTYPQFCQQARCKLRVADRYPPFPFDDAGLMQSLYQQYYQARIHHQAFLFKLRSDYHRLHKSSAMRMAA